MDDLYFTLEKKAFGHIDPILREAHEFENPDGPLPYSLVPDPNNLRQQALHHFRSTSATFYTLTWRMRKGDLLEE